jgi:hypothetical protein
MSKKAIALYVDPMIFVSLQNIITKLINESDKSPMQDLGEVFDDDLKKFWTDSIIIENKSYLSSLKQFFASIDKKTGKLSILLKDVEAILKGITYLRLFIFKDQLSPYIDEIEIERGEVDLEKIPELCVHYYWAYVVLAQIQEIIIGKWDS